MELPLSATTLITSEPPQLPAGSGRAAKTSDLEATIGESPRQPAKHFDDILGQTLAGPLFATWTPTAPVNPVSGAASANSSNAPLDPNARRDGRRRSRR